MHLACRWVLLLGAAAALAAGPADAETAAPGLLADAALPGGLCVHLGCGDGAMTDALRGGGRFLVHGLGADAARVAEARRFLQARGVYGQAWVEVLAGPRLPYAENLVNLVVVDAAAAPAAPFADIVRVVCPNGVVYVGADAQAATDALLGRMEQAGMRGSEVVRLGGTWVRWRKPWPADMDEWGHPRHGADGNAVSGDRLVGPPRRTRWVAGPMHEASNAVTAGGRFFHAGLVARDAFNGLRLWQKPIEPAPLRLGYPARAIAGSVLPVATGDRVYVVHAGKLEALDAATGLGVRIYGDAGSTRHLLCAGGLLVAVGADSVRAFDAAGGALRWTHPAAEPDGVVAGDGGLFLLEGAVRRGEERAVLRLDLATGRPSWRHADYDWAPKVSRCSYHDGRLICEVSTFNNDRPGNGIRVLSADDGRPLWNRLYEPGMAHYVQARALQTGGLVWVLNGLQWEGLDPATGSVTRSYGARTSHCFPPVGTPQYLLAGEMTFTAIEDGLIDANRITKGACGRDAGFIPANGLVYLTPKHCACYPMMNGYVALAPARAGPPDASAAEPLLEPGPAAGEAAPGAADIAPDDWPSYRADAWRSGAAPAAVPADLVVRWTARLGDWPQGPLVEDWRENLFVGGPVTPPVVAGGLVVVAQPDRHRVVALDARTGAPRWDFTANGRIDTPPTLWRDRCLFGTRSGWVYALRAADGQLAWRLRVGPNDDRVVSFGQLESPWPVPGSVLVVGDTAYVAGGRHPLADGGVRVLALDPASGRVKWQGRIDSLPYEDYYGGAGLEFDGFDLLVAEAAKPQADAAAPAPSPVPSLAPAPGSGPDYITLSRWRMNPATGAAEVVPQSGFAYARAGGGGVMVPRGLWTYGPRMNYIASGPPPGKPDYVRVTRRPLMVFRGGMLVASSDDKQRLFRKDFTPEEAAAFNDTWYNQRHLPRPNKPGDRSRSERLSHGAAWEAEAFGGKGGGVAALVLAGETVFAAGKTGGLWAWAAADGKRLGRRDLPPPVWDGMAAARGALYVSTADGRVICLGGK